MNGRFFPVAASVAAIGECWCVVARRIELDDVASRWECALASGGMREVCAARDAGVILTAQARGADGVMLLLAQRRAGAAQRVIELATQRERAAGGGEGPVPRESIRRFLPQLATGGG